MPAYPQDAPAPHRKLRVLGVDPAVAGATGYGIIDLEGSRPQLVRFGFAEAARPRHVRISPARNPSAYFTTCGRIRSGCGCGRIRFHRSEHENGVAPRGNARRGIAGRSAGTDSRAQLFAARDQGQRFGFRGASKQQMQQMVASVLGLTENPEPADAADALAVALCHAHVSRARERFLIASAGARRISMRVSTAAAVSARAARAGTPSI